MKIIKCDRCGKEIEYSQGMPVFLVTRTNTHTHMDMCKECRCDLVAFMHNAKVEFIEEAEKKVEFIEEAEKGEKEIMTNKEAMEILKEEWRINAELFGKQFDEALDLAIKALEFQERFIDIVTQAVVNSGCDSFEEFCEKIGVHNEEARE